MHDNQPKYTLCGYGPFTSSVSVNTVTMLAILLSLKTIESLQNWVATHIGAIPLFSMRAISLASSQHCRSVDGDAGGQCKQALTDPTSSSSFSIRVFAIGTLSACFCVLFWRLRCLSMKRVKNNYLAIHFIIYERMFQETLALKTYLLSCLCLSFGGPSDSSVSSSLSSESKYINHTSIIKSSKSFLYYDYEKLVGFFLNIILQFLFDFLIFNLFTKHRL